MKSNLKKVSGLWLGIEGNNPKFIRKHTLVRKLVSSQRDVREGICSGDWLRRRGCSTRDEFQGMLKALLGVRFSSTRGSCKLLAKADALRCHAAKPGYSLKTKGKCYSLPV